MNYDNFTFEVGVIAQKDAALTFADYLVSINIKAIVREKLGGNYSVCVDNELALYRARTEFAEFAGDPLNRKYKNAAWQRGRVLRKRPEIKARGFTLFSMDLVSFTTAVEAVCVIVYLLMFAARRDHLVKTIWPALKQGKTVISDRFADSSMAYQGFGYADKAVGAETIERLYDIVIGKFKPDLTIILDMPVEVGIERALQRDDTVNRYEKMGMDFHHNLRKAFLEIQQKDPQRCAVVDARGTIQQIHDNIINTVKERLLKEL